MINDFIPKNHDVLSSPLGKTSAYIETYTPELLFPIPRVLKRQEINVSDPLPFYGFDTWNAYELSWLNTKGKPNVAIARFDIACTSKNIIESKSFKLYLNSFNHSHFDNPQNVLDALQRDTTLAADGQVRVELYPLETYNNRSLQTFQGKCLDHHDIDCDTYTTHPDYLTSDPATLVHDTLYSNLLKSNCLVTGQPDWGSVHIKYSGPKIDENGLLRYLISFRNHNEFHEQCVERIFMDIMERCQPTHLSVEARYTRRGGLDINPIRSTKAIDPSANIRMARQ